MSSDEVVQEKIKIQLVRFQVYVFVVVALAGAVYGLMLNYQENVINKITSWVGFIFLVGLFIGIIHHYISTRKFIKQLGKTK
ncbi:MAG: hypothetical protein FVQ77_15870 [Cytophagales bacterium]|nr:hypothetical protein [Cytophagales bacterium]